MPLCPAGGKDRGDAALADGHVVTAAGLAAGAVEDGDVADDEIGHGASGRADAAMNAGRRHRRCSHRGRLVKQATIDAPGSASTARRLTAGIGRHRRRACRCGPAARPHRAARTPPAPDRLDTGASACPRNTCAIGGASTYLVNRRTAPTAAGSVRVRASSGRRGDTDTMRAVMPAIKRSHRYRRLEAPEEVATETWKRWASGETERGEPRAGPPGGTCRTSRFPRSDAGLPARPSPTR